MYWDRFDICEAYAVMEWHWNKGGIVRERPSNARRNASTDWQLHRMGFKPRPSLEWNTLTANGRAIYAALVSRCGLRRASANNVLWDCRRMDSKGGAA